MQRQSAQFLKNLRRFRLITFDVTDTILRFRYPVSVEYKMTAEEMGVTAIDEKNLDACFRREFKSLAKLYPNFGSGNAMPWQKWWLILVENVFATIKPDLSKEQRTQLASVLVHKYRTKNCWSEIGGARPLIEKIRACGKHLGVISNFDNSLDIVLREMELVNQFDFILTSYAAGVQKPNKGIFDKAIEQCNLKANEALHIGNSYDLDYVGARNAGWTSLLVTSNAPASAHAYSSLNELLLTLENRDIEWT